MAVPTAPFFMPSTRGIPGGGCLQGRFRFLFYSDVLSMKLDMILAIFTISVFLIP